MKKVAVSCTVVCVRTNQITEECVKFKICGCTCLHADLGACVCRYAWKWCIFWTLFIILAASFIWYVWHTQYRKHVWQFLLLFFIFCSWSSFSYSNKISWAFHVKTKNNIQRMIKHMNLFEMLPTDEGNILNIARKYNHSYTKLTSNFCINFLRLVTTLLYKIHFPGWCFECTWVHYPVPRQLQSEHRWPPMTFKHYFESHWNN